MKYFCRIIYAVLILAVIIAGWIYWQFPARVEMARYAPSDALVYLEANDLPEIFRDYSETEAWRALAPQFGIRPDYGAFGWFSRFLANANLGSTETVVFGRSQIAVVLVGIEAGGAEESLKIKPRYAVVVETKTSRRTAERFVEKQLGDFARRQFNEASREKLERGAAVWTIFRSLKDERKLFAAVAEGTIIFGNDETAIQKCFDARNELRPSLAQSPQLAEMRAETDAANSFAFGFVTNQGVRQLSQIGAVLFAAQMTDQPAAMSLIAQSLPPMIEKTVSGIGWTARNRDGKIEDRYFIAAPPDFAARLREPFSAANQPAIASANFLPEETGSVTIYNFQNPGAAWRGFLLAVSTKLDALGAAAFSQVAGKLLEPYGIGAANDFLSAAGNEIVTARLSEKENETVTIVKVGDGGKMLAAIEPAAQNNNRSATFTDGWLLLGENEDVARCLSANNQSLAKTSVWREFVETKLSTHAPFVRTLTREQESATDFVRLFGDEKLKQTVPDLTATPRLTVSIAETSLRENGFERRTVSPFGLLGTLVSAFSE